MKNQRKEGPSGLLIGPFLGLLVAAAFITGSAPKSTNTNLANGSAAPTATPIPTPNGMLTTAAYEAGLGPDRCITVIEGNTIYSLARRLDASIGTDFDVYTLDPSPEDEVGSDLRLLTDPLPAYILTHSDDRLCAYADNP